MAKNMPNVGVSRWLTQLAVILASVAIAWALTSHQVTDNTGDIKEIKTVDLVKLDNDKLDKEVFGMYIEQQEQAAERRDKVLGRMDDKLDLALKK